jgi:enamine deaminase RidA (YjgF/YER057c/UK114 family)
MADERRTLHPPGWKPAAGYANGIVATGPVIFVGGQIGWNADQVSKATTSSSRHAAPCRTLWTCWRKPEGSRNILSA